MNANDLDLLSAIHCDCPRSMPAFAVAVALVAYRRQEGLEARVADLRRLVPLSYDHARKALRRACDALDATMQPARDAPVSATRPAGASLAGSSCTGSTRTGASRAGDPARDASVQPARDAPDHNARDPEGIEDSVVGAAGPGIQDPESWELEPPPPPEPVAATDESTSRLEVEGPRYFDPDGNPIELPEEPEPDRVEEVIAYCRERFPDRQDFPHEIRTVRRELDLDCLKMALWKASRGKNVRGFGLIRTIAREFKAINRWHWPRPEQHPDDPPPLPESLLETIRLSNRCRQRKEEAEAARRAEAIRDAMAAAMQA